MITKLELEEILNSLNEGELLEIEFTSNRQSAFDSAQQGVCYYVKTSQAINPSAADKILVMTMDFKVTESSITIKNQYTKQLPGNATQHNLVTKIIPLDQINNLTIV